MNVEAILFELPLQAKVVAGLLLVLTFAFVAFYLFPGVAQWFSLRGVTRKLQGLQTKSPTDFGKIFQGNKRLKHLWREYQETLHPQKELNSATGNYDIKRYRSTVPAEVIFSREFLADTVVSSEFFRHLPGIFTGLGIIGTFIGLIGGIRGFTVSENSQVVREGLNSLLHDVSEAFFVSFGAIAIAMVVTLVEKLLISRLYSKVEELCQEIDASFESGAGEEYLARLVKASESSEKETKILKDALIPELKQVLEALTNRQIEEAANNAKETARQIVEGVNTSLGEPMKRIGDAVASVGGNQAEAVNKIIVDTMSAMTAQIRDIFGDQIQGINELQQKTIGALQESLGRLDELTQKMGQTGAQATDQMAAKVGEAIAGMEARQRAMNDELARSVAAIGASVAEMTRGLQAVVEAASKNDQTRAETQAAQARQNQQAMDENLGKTLAEVANVGEAIQQAVARMEKVTMDTVLRMNEGANTLYIAASDFAKAGEKTSETLERANVLSGQLGSASAALTGSSNSLSSAVAEYKSVREEVLRLVTELRSTVESAKTEASLTADVLSRIQAATQNLANAEREAGEYLEKVTSVLAEAHGEFASNVTSTLQEANSAFHQHLTQATQMLGDTVDGLTEVFERIPTS